MPRLLDSMDVYKLGEGFPWDFHIFNIREVTIDSTFSLIVIEQRSLSFGPQISLLSMPLNQLTTLVKSIFTVKRYIDYGSARRLSVVKGWHQRYPLIGSSSIAKLPTPSNCFRLRLWVPSWHVLAATGCGYFFEVCFYRGSVLCFFCGALENNRLRIGTKKKFSYQYVLRMGTRYFFFSYVEWLHFGQVSSPAS